MAVLCRVCLCSDRHVSAINNTVLQRIWEKLTNAELNNNDGKPLEVCYMCYAHLRKTYQLMQKAVKAEAMLNAFINNGLQSTHNAISKVSSLVHEFDYSYAIKEAVQCETITRSKVSEIKTEIEDNNEEENELIIKKEEEECSDSCQEENLDNVGVEPEIGDGEPPQKMTLEKEVRIVLEKINVVALRRKRKLIEVPQNVKRIKLNAIKNWKPLSNFISTSLLKNNCKAPDRNFSRRKALEQKVEISESTQITNLCNSYGVDSVSPKVCITQNETDKAQNVILHNEKAHIKNISKNNAENEICKLSISRSATSLAPNLSLLRSNEENKSNICYRERSKNDFSCHVCHYKCVTKIELNNHLRKHNKKKPYMCDLCDQKFKNKCDLICHIKYKHTKEKNFLCHICPYQCVTQSYLHIHLRKHSKKPYICELCDYRCSLKGNLKSHMQYKHTKEKKFSCQICQYKCVTKGNLNVHLRKHSKKPYICELCDYRSLRKSHLKSHMQYKHIKEKNFSCHICHYKCVTTCELNIHLRKHTKPYICELCDYRCSQKGHLKSHMQYKHTKEKKFSCQICQYKCVTKGTLNMHLRKHSKEKPYICESCDYRCSRKSSLKSHMQYIHTKEKNFSCHICQYKCVTTCELNIHLRKHTKPYICELCDYRSLRKSHLKSHMQYKHIKEKNFSCHICHYKCVTTCELNIHLRKHTKPYICELCDYRCSQKGHLKSHMQYKHTKEKKFSCQICQYKCVTKGTLNMHLRKHSKEKPYICESCDYRCSRKSSLKSHMQYIHTKEKNFSCHICQYKCVAISRLRKHLQKHTKKKPSTCERKRNLQENSVQSPENSQN